MPRKLHEMYQNAITKRTREQSARTRDRQGLDELAARAKGKITNYTVQERRGQDFPDE